VIASADVIVVVACIDCGVMSTGDGGGGHGVGRSALVDGVS